MSKIVSECIVSALKKGKYEVKVRTQMDELMEILFRVEGKRTGNPEFDPTLHDLHEGNSLWIEICNRDGETVATSAARLLDTQDLVDLTRTYKLWYGDKIHFTEQLRIIVAPDVLIPHGRLVFDGAMWVRPDHRRCGFSWVLGRLLKAAAFEKWNPDWILGLAFRGIARSRLPLYSYGYFRLDPFATGYRLPGYACQDLSLASMSRAEFIRFTAENEEFLARSPDLTIGPELALRVRAGKQDVQRPAARQIVPEADLEIAS